MNFVDIGHGVVALGQLNHFADGRNVAAHRIDAFKRNQLRLARRNGGELCLQILHAVMFEDELVRARAPDAFNH